VFAILRRSSSRPRCIVRLGIIGLVETSKIIGDPPVEAADLLGDLTVPHDLLAARHRPKLGAVQRHQPGLEQARIPAQHHEGATGSNDRRAIIATEIGDRLEVRRQPPQQPHRLDIAPAFALKTPRRTNLVEITPDIKPQQIARIVGRPSCSSRHSTVEAETDDVQPFNEGIDHPYRRIRCDIVLDQSR
jgi:hypothetical protein